MVDNRQLGCDSGHVKELLIDFFFLNVKSLGCEIIFLIVDELDNRHAVFDIGDFFSGSPGCCGRGNFIINFVIIDVAVGKDFVDGSVSKGRDIVNFRHGLQITVIRRAAADNAAAHENRGKQSRKHRHDNHEFLRNRLVQANHPLTGKIYKDNY